MCGQSLALFLLIRCPPYVVFMFVVFHGFFFFVSSLSSDIRFRWCIVPSW
ncbi:unnamed protein product [Amoebophrya sp. A120]|nr:unnamed protein product [Amoebophrya sp. A120]|eukprot:GSA120T00009310001.1